jgi:hypothetical protein
LRYALAAGALFVLAAAPAQADTIVGSLPLSSAGVSSTSTNLSAPGVVVSATDSVVLTLGTGDLNTVPLLESFGPTTLDTNDLLSFTFSNATYGTFTTTSGVIITQNTGFLNVYLLGTFSAPGFDDSPASVQVTYTSSAGGSVSGGFTLNAPPSPIVPEPASIAMAGIGLATVGLVRTLRKRTV